MALTIAIEGKGVIANCDSLVDDTGGTGTGDWSEQGGGTMTLSPDVYLVGSGSIGGKYAGKSGFQQFDLGVGNELDFSPGGTEEGQFIYMWVNMAAFGVLETLANAGLAIRISSDSPGTSNYCDFTIASAADANGWTGGWKLFVIDPSLTASRVSGTQSSIIASVQTVGIWIDAVGSVRAESLWIDQISVGKGLRITGTSTTSWKDIMEYCTAYSSRGWGMMQERDGIYYIFGKIYIGDTTLSTDVSFADSDRVLQFGTSQYYESSSWKTSFAIDGAGIIIEDEAAGNKTDFIDGVIVGTDNGRSGSVIIGNTDQNIILDLYGSNNAASATLCYGTTFKSIEGAFNSGDDVGHKFLGCSFLKCSQFDPVGAPVIRNCTFAETADLDAALLWNENIDIQKCSFIGNAIGAAIEHPSAAGTPYTHTTLSFSGNTDDVLNSSGSAITIENAGSNGSSSEGAAVSFVASSTIYIKVQDQSKTIIIGAYIYINDDDSGSAEINTTTDGSGEVNDSYSGSVTTATLRIRKYGFKPFVDTVDLSEDITRIITLVTDPQQT